MNKLQSYLHCKYLDSFKVITLYIQYCVEAHIHNQLTYSSVSNMIASLNCQTLEQRRKLSEVTYIFKIHHNLVHVDHNHLIPTRNLNFLIPHSRTNYHANSFFPWSIRLWNSLPISIQSSASLNIFAEQLPPTFKL